MDTLTPLDPRTMDRNAPDDLHAMTTRAAVAEARIAELQPMLETLRDEYSGQVSSLAKSALQGADLAAADTEAHWSR